MLLKGHTRGSLTIYSSFSNSCMRKFINYIQSEHFQTMISTKVLSPSLVFRFSIRTFSTSDNNHRDRSVIYNCENRPEPILDEKFREKVWSKENYTTNTFFPSQLINGYKHPRSLPIVVPSKDFTKSVQNMLEKGIIDSCFWQMCVINQNNVCSLHLSQGAFKKLPWGRRQISEIH